MSDIFRPLFRSVEDKVANRRDQLRKAQKTFRERRDQYLRTLERSVKRLQSHEARLQDEVEQLKRELTATKSRLGETEADLFRLQASNNGAIHSTSDWGSFEFQSVSPPAKTYGSPFNNSEVGSFASSATTLVWVETKNDQPVQMHIDLTSSKSGTAYVFQLDVVVIAMEFVLKLESPCLPHLQQNADDGIPAANSSPHGHVHTASAALLCCSSSSSPLSASSSPSSPVATTAWPVHKATLDRLLDISQDLPVDQAVELTPVQVWGCIAQAPQFNILQVDTLKRMSEKLLNHMKCYGFGAVVRRDFLMKTMAELIR